MTNTVANTTRFSFLSSLNANTRATRGIKKRNFEKREVTREKWVGTTVAKHSRQLRVIVLTISKPFCFRSSAVAALYLSQIHTSLLKPFVEYKCATNDDGICRQYLTARPIFSLSISFSLSLSLSLPLVYCESQ